MSFPPYPDPGRRLRATTILGVRRDGAVALAGDGQVTQGDIVVKHGARKIRTLSDGQVLAGFAGAVADGLTLLARFETELKAWDGNLRRAAVELVKEWRTDRYLRRLEAQLIVGDPDGLLVLSGEGDVFEPDDGIAAIGSGSPYATAAAKALLLHTRLDARATVEAAMTIAADICIFTNHRFSVESVGRVGEGAVATEGDAAADERELPLDGFAPPPDPGGAASAEEDEDDEDEEREAARGRDRDDPADDEEEDGE